MALLSMHVAQLMTLLLVVPTLLALSAPVWLWQQLHDRTIEARLMQRLGDPVNGLALVMALLVGVYGTPVLELSLRHVPVHLAVQALSLVVGFAVMWSLVGADALLDRHLTGRDRVVLALALAGVLVGFGVLIVVRRDLLASAWFAELRWTWADPLVDQRRAAAVAWVFAQVMVPLLLAAAYVQASRRPSSEATRRGRRTR